MSLDESLGQDLAFILPGRKFYKSGRFPRKPSRRGRRGSSLGQESNESRKHGGNARALLLGQAVGGFDDVRIGAERQFFHGRALSGEYVSNFKYIDLVRIKRLASNMQEPGTSPRVPKRRSRFVG